MEPQTWDCRLCCLSLFRMLSLKDVWPATELAADSSARMLQDVPDITRLPITTFAITTFAAASNSRRAGTPTSTLDVTLLLGTLLGVTLHHSLHRAIIDTLSVDGAHFAAVCCIC